MAQERCITVDVTVRRTGLVEEEAYHAEATVAMAASKHRVVGNGDTPSKAAAMAVRDLFFGWDMEGQPGQDCW